MNKKPKSINEKSHPCMPSNDLKGDEGGELNRRAKDPVHDGSRHMFLQGREFTDKG